MEQTLSDVNDLLKSMVLRDLDGGHISTVSYDSNAPVERTLKSFAINLTSNPSFGDLLNQTRGEKVEVVLQQINATQPSSLSGTVIGVEKQKVAVAKDTVDMELLNLRCSDGLHSLRMSDVQRVRFLNPTLDSEFKKALETLALSHDTQKKSVSINCIGEGKRAVCVGYVIENPIWKTSYRLVLDKKQQPYLQGWAIVENPTDEDWKDVHMALVSGRPISFQMDLYQPLFASRPVVEPELFASLRPPTYNGDLYNDVNGVARIRKSVEENRRVAELMKQFKTLYKEGKYVEAEQAAKLAMELDPDNGVATAAIHIAHNQRGMNSKQDREDYSLNAMNAAEKPTPGDVVGNDISFDGERWNKKKSTAKEREIEDRLRTPANLNFTETPLRQVLEDVRNFYGINIWTDDHALIAEGINLDQRITIKLEQISLKSALMLILRGSRLTFFIKDEVLQITTEREARGRQMAETSLGQSVAAAATTGKLGSFFHYTIDKPVTLARQKNAMLPIVSKDIQGERVSIYNEQTQARFPLLGVKLKNTLGLHLMQGPVTVFEGSNYAGDSRILDLQPNEERLISYAIDLGTEVNPVGSAEGGRMVYVKAVKGILQATTKIRAAKTYTIKNRNDIERVVLVEHPVRNDFKLIETEKPAETASDFYRFQVKVAPGKKATLTVSEERIVDQSITLASSSDEQLRSFMGQTVATRALKNGLRKAIDLRSAISGTQQEIGELDRQLKVILEDQVRLRANLKEMPANAAAYKRYLQKFDDQETQIEDYQDRIKKLQTVEFNQKKELDDYLVHFSIE